MKDDFDIIDFDLTDALPEIVNHDEFTKEKIAEEYTKDGEYPDEVLDDAVAEYSDITEEYPEEGTTEEYWSETMQEGSDEYEAEEYSGEEYPEEAYAEEYLEEEYSEEEYFEADEPNLYNEESGALDIDEENAADNVFQGEVSVDTMIMNDIAKAVGSEEEIYHAEHIIYDTASSDKIRQEIDAALAEDNEEYDTYYEEDDLSDDLQIADFGQDTDFIVYEELDAIEEEPEKPVKKYGRKKKTVKTVILDIVKKMTVGDWLIASAAVLIFVMAGVTLTFWGKNQALAQETAGMYEAGYDLANLGIPGESGLLALSDAAMSQAIIESVQPTETPEATDEIRVTFTSVEQDIKIKFIDNGTNRLITDIVFEVTLTDEDGDEILLKDEDEDGIIYENNMEPGDYTVEVADVEGYTILDFETTITVKDQIVYEEIDVTQEIKTESEIDATVEDTAVNNQEAEEEAETLPTVTDTVEWVESTRTPLDGSDGYQRIDKSNIEEPSYASRNVIEVDLIQNADEGYLNNYMQMYTLIRTQDGVSENTPGSEEPEETPTPTATPEPTETPTTEEKTATITISGAAGMKVGDTLTLSATAKDGSSTLSGGTYTWSSSNSSIATVDGGKVTAVAEGTATITVTYSHSVTQGNLTTKYTGTATASITVSKADVTVKSVTLTPETATIKVGESTTLTSSAEMSDGSKVTTGFTWATDNDKIATVDQNGKVTGVAKGTAVITVTYKDAQGNTQKDTATITVTEAAATVTSVSLNKATVTLAVGKTETLTATAIMSSGSNVTDASKFTFTSNKTSVATVDSTGKITAVAKGTATITVSYKDAAGNTKTATCTVTVTDLTITSLALNKTTTTIADGNTESLVATATMSDGTKITDASKFTWTSNATTVATVDNAGKITALDAGTATITVSYKDSAGTTKTATCTVTVVANPANDTTTKLYDKNGNQVYVKNSSGEYVPATYADYFRATEFYIQSQTEYRYTGWQTINGNVYYYDKNGNKVTGEQIIQGVKYNFTSEGILAMDNNGVMGIDVSKWNGSIDWTAVKNSGISFVIIRCGYRGSSTGVLVEDPMFRSNIQGATAAGLKVGVYFFTQAVNEVEAVEEASMVISLIRNYGISYPVFIDTERSGGRADAIDRNTRTAVCRAFCETIKNAGYTPGVYASKSWYNDNLNYSSLSGYRIWLAQYASEPTFANRYDLWQYTERGTVNGINGNVDLNISYLGY